MAEPIDVILERLREALQRVILFLDHPPLTLEAHRERGETMEFLRALAREAMRGLPGEEKFLFELSVKAFQSCRYGLPVDERQELGVWLRRADVTLHTWIRRG